MYSVRTLSPPSYSREHLVARTAIKTRSRRKRSNCFLLPNHKSLISLGEHRNDAMPRFRMTSINADSTSKSQSPICSVRRWKEAISKRSARGAIYQIYNRKTTRTDSGKRLQCLFDQSTIEISKTRHSLLGSSPSEIFALFQQFRSSFSRPKSDD